MPPKIKTLTTANVIAWPYYRSTSTEASICKETGLSAADLKKKFASSFSYLYHKGTSYQVHMLQHPGVRYDHHQEDKARFLSLAFNSTLTLDEIIATVTKTIEDLAKSILERQKSNEIADSGCTLSGILTFSLENKMYALVIGSGDSIVCAVTNNLKCTSLINVHNFSNPSEKKRVLDAVLKTQSSTDTLRDAIVELAQKIKMEKKKIWLKDNEEDEISNYWIAKVNELRRNTPEYSAKITPLNNCLSKAQMHQFAYILYINKTLDEFLLSKKITDLKAVDCIHAILGCIESSLIYVDSSVNDISPTRGFGEYRMQVQGGHSYIPEINLYELPPGEEILLLTASDGISDVRSPLDIERCARNVTPRFDHNKEFLEELLYDCYTYDRNSCDNLTVCCLHLSGQPLNNVALFINLMDGHGYKRGYNSKDHVVNVANNELGPALKRNMLVAIAQKKQTQQSSATVQQVITSQQVIPPDKKETKELNLATLNYS